VAVLGACGKGDKTKAKCKAKVSFTQGGMLRVRFDNEVAPFEAAHQGDTIEGIAQV
jgi:hypothetical protein